MGDAVVSSVLRVREGNLVQSLMIMLLIRKAVTQTKAVVAEARLLGLSTWLTSTSI
jgi:hypothetical protein